MRSTSARSGLHGWRGHFWSVQRQVLLGDGLSEVPLITAVVLPGPEEPAVGVGSELPELAVREGLDDLPLLGASQFAPLLGGHHAPIPRRQCQTPLAHDDLLALLTDVFRVVLLAFP